MSRQPKYLLYVAVLLCLFANTSCGGKKAKSQNIATSPEELQEKSSAFIAGYLQQATAGDGKTTDSAWRLLQPRIVKLLYEGNGNNLLWSAGQSWKPGGDSLSNLIFSARYYGLFPEDYHAKELRLIRKEFSDDSLSKSARRDALLWSKADLMLTDAFVQLIKDIRFGRLPDDSISLNNDSLLADDFFVSVLSQVKESGAFTTLTDSLEPTHWGYSQLKSSIPAFLQQASFKDFTRVPAKGQPNYKSALQKRLFEGGYISFDSVTADSAQLAEAVKKFQKEKGITVDGRAGDGTIRMLNLSDEEKFIRIAISMDKYKKLPRQMPEKYIWVNTSSNYLDVVEGQKVQFSSKVISGKPGTRTPLLNSAVSILITYPQWVPPPSIVSKEILPAVKKNPGYLSKKGFSLLDKDGNEVDPYSVDWSKYSKGTPYRIVQGSGDANALGVLKFHFDNKYSVYLHDTNQRYLFANAMRSLSHGCVRVQDWQKLARYILRNDSLQASKNYKMGDSLSVWLNKKEKHHIPVKNKLPVYIRYFTCEGKDGQVVFYDDVYGEDKFIREKYFAGR